jgi:SPP1 family predicted phage head-tail adaptor
MNINGLRHKITLQERKNTENEYGESTEEWIDIYTIWASVNPVVGREYFAAETVNSEVTHKIRIRYKENINPFMRVKFKERFFRIISVIDFEEKNLEMQLMCKELIE